MSQYVALQILEKLINVRWKILPEDQRSGIRNFIVQIIIKVSSDEQTLRREKSYVNKVSLLGPSLFNSVLISSASLTSSLSKYVHPRLAQEPNSCAALQILKQEWPHNWPTFISEIVSSSKSNLTLCENNMIILKLMSEEIFDYSAEQMTTTKTRNLKNQMCQEFA
jgi:exportin-1